MCRSATLRLGSLNSNCHAKATIGEWLGVVKKIVLAVLDVEVLSMWSLFKNLEKLTSGYVSNFF